MLSKDNFDMVSHFQYNIIENLSIYAFFTDLGIFSQVSLSSEQFADWRAWPREPGRAGQGLLFEATWDLATNHEAPNLRVKQTSNLPIQPPRPQIQQSLGRERNPQLEPKKGKSAGGWCAFETRGCTFR